MTTLPTNKTSFISQRQSFNYPKQLADQFFLDVVLEVLFVDLVRILHVLQDGASCQDAMRDVQREHESALQLVDGLDVAGPHFQLLVRQQRWSRRIVKLAIDAQIVEHFVDFVEEDVVKLDAVSEALLALEHNLDVDLRLVVLALRDEMRDFVWKFVRQVQNDAVKCLGVSDDFFVLH